MIKSLRFALAIALILPLLGASPGVWPDDLRYEGRFRVGSQYHLAPPSHLNHFDNEVELRNGLLGTLWEGEKSVIDFEFVLDFLYTGGIREQAGLAEEYDAEIFRGWLRWEKENIKVRAGRQQILFGSGSLFRPLGFFDTRIISGVIPLTRGVDGARATYFPGPTSLVEGWAVPAKTGERAIWGLRGERQLGLLEVGGVVQYHPKTKLGFLNSSQLELFQFGYHIKGEKVVGFWNESRIDVEQDKPGKPLRFDSVVGTDYTFDVGQGLHVLFEYFVRAQEPGFTLEDIKRERTQHFLGMQLDQPVGIDIVWRFFGFYDLRDRSFQLAPQIEYNLIDQVYLYLTARIGGSINGNNQTGRLFRDLPVYTGTESSVGLTLIAFY